jgi:glyoxylase-like metal-dependent hydrolase (beta-lactamase superfamily II)
MRVVSLHADVIVATSAIWQTNCTLVRCGEEAFAIDSPILPAELQALPALFEQAGFTPSGLLATHGDWDHLLARLAFPTVALGCAEGTAARMKGGPGEPQRELRAFDEQYYVQRDRPLMLGSVQGLPVPGRCGIGELELELHPAEGHTEDGMAVWIPWARVLVAGDYLSSVEIPFFGEGGGTLASYVATLKRLRPLVAQAASVVPGHGPVLDSTQALAVLEEDLAYLRALDARGGPVEDARGEPVEDARGESVGDARGGPVGDARGESVGDARGGPMGDVRGEPVGAGRSAEHGEEPTPLPAGRSTPAQRQLHAQNLARLPQP